MKERKVRVFGFGGQGIITFAHVTGEAGILDGKEVIMTEEYSPYVTGGWSRADLILSGEKIDYPMINEMDYLITLSQEGLDKNLGKVTKGGTIFIEKDLVSQKNLKNFKVAAINAKAIAEKLGNGKATNIVMLGFFNKITSLVSEKSLFEAVKKRFPKAEKLNMDALEAGFKEAASYV